MSEKHTSALFAELKENGTFVKFLQGNKDCFIKQNFSEYLNMLCKEKSLSVVQIIKNAQIDRVYGQQLFSGTRKPSREKVLQLAFGFELSLEEAQKMLQMADKSRLYPKIKRDAAVIYGLNNRLQMWEMQELLFSVGLPVLGEG